jgi:hypothetical protein
LAFFEHTPLGTQSHLSKSYFAYCNKMPWGRVGWQHWVTLI